MRKACLFWFALVLTLAAAQVEIKVSYGEEFRRLVLYEQTYSYACETIAGLFGLDPNSLVLKYIDEDGDKIAVASDAEFHIAARVGKELKVLRVFVETKAAENRVFEPTKLEPTNFEVISFEPTKFINKRVTIRSAHGTYFRANPGGEGARLDLQVQVNAWEKFFVQEVGNGRVAFRTAHGTFFRACPGGAGATLDLQVAVREWEHFQIQVVGDKWALKTYHGTYARAYPGGEGAKIDLNTHVTATGWELFDIMVTY